MKFPEINFSTSDILFNKKERLMKIMLLVPEFNIILTNGLLCLNLSRSWNSWIL